MYVLYTYIQAYTITNTIFVYAYKRIYQRYAKLVVVYDLYSTSLAYSWYTHIRAYTTVVQLN